MKAIFQSLSFSILLQEPLARIRNHSQNDLMPRLKTWFCLFDDIVVKPGSKIDDFAAWVDYGVDTVT